MKLIKISLLFFALAVFMFNCGGAPETAETGEAQEVDETQKEESVEFKVDPASTEVAWAAFKGVGAIPAGGHNGTFPVTEGVVNVKGGEIVGGKYTFSVENMTVKDIPVEEESHAKLLGHLKDTDFLEAAKFPNASFEITGVEAYKAPEGEEATEETTDEEAAVKPLEEQETTENPTHWITGNLTLKGVSKSVKFPANVSLSEESVSAKAVFYINRTDWELVYNNDASLGDKFIRDEVKISFDITASK